MRKLTYELTTSKYQQNAGRKRPPTNNFIPQPVRIKTLILTVKHLRKTNAVREDAITFKFNERVYLQKRII